MKPSCQQLVTALHVPPSPKGMASGAEAGPCFCSVGSKLSPPAHRSSKVSLLATEVNGRTRACLAWTVSGGCVVDAASVAASIRPLFPHRPESGERGGKSRAPPPRPPRPPTARREPAGRPGDGRRPRSPPLDHHAREPRAGRARTPPNPRIQKRNGRCFRNDRSVLSAAFSPVIPPPRSPLLCRGIEQDRCQIPQIHEIHWGTTLSGFGRSLESGDFRLLFTGFRHWIPVERTPTEGAGPSRFVGKGTHRPGPFRWSVRRL